MSDIITLKDSHIITDLLSERGGVKKTRITITDHYTGEVLQEIENKTLVPGSQMTACKQFGIDPVVEFPTYNQILGVEHSLEPYSVKPANEPITCLWCAGRSGYATAPGEILSVANTDRINAVDDIVPFRYVSEENDLDSDMRRIYFGRKKNPTTGMISYYWKAFDTLPQLHVRYLDGTEVTSNMYAINSSQQVEIYVEMRLSVTRLDFRSYFDYVLGWDKADISTISLLTGWYDRSICENPDAEEINKIYYKWYQDVLPFSKFNFKAEDLTNLDRAIDFNYQVFY